MKTIFWKTYTVCMAIFMAFASSAVLAIAINGTVHVFSAGEAVSAARINENFQSLKSTIESIQLPNAVPIGTIVAWHKDLPGSGGTLPDGWVECDGGTLNDPQSRFDGVPLPNLNGQARFLRGGTISGLVQNDAFQGHRHLRNIYGTQEFVHRASTAIGQQYWAGLGIVEPHATTGGVSPDPLYGLPRVAAETRPINMSVIWIIKVR